MSTRPSSAQGPWLCVRSQGPAHPQRRTLTPAGLGQQPQAAHLLPLTVSGAYRQVADDQQIPNTEQSHRWLDRHMPARCSVRIRPAPQEHHYMPGTLGAQSTHLSSPHPSSTPVCTSGRSQETLHSKPHGERSWISRWGGLVPLFSKAVSTRANALSKHAAELGEAGHGQVTRTSPHGHCKTPVSTKGKRIGSRVKTGAARENGRFASPVQLAHGQEPHLPAAVKGVGT